MNTFTVNGTAYALDASSREQTLMHFLREELSLTGTKNGCAIGQCGSCTVLVNRKAVRSCTIPLHRIAGKHVLTIEALSQDGDLHPIQQAFIDAGALQCGFCTPGMIMSSYGLLISDPSPTREEIRLALRGNICRCTGYQQIIDAVELAALRVRELGTIL